VPNRLADARSPYLRQHAGNPVDWWPWSDEAFAEARRRDVPVFLSVGYATCHWCHVMEHESFEHPEAARLLNEAFVCVKVDREERPDVDAIYMAVCQAMTGHGGWPLTVLLTPDRKPFVAATYLPRESRHGRTGLMEFVPRISEAWRTQRAGIGATADRITEVLSGEMRAGAAPEAPGPEVLDRAAARLASRFDEAHGGFGGAPKFPTPHNLLFLLRAWKRTDEGVFLALVEHTLRAMRAGGIWDHVGGGFHRYATDARWLLPHFEKMLYDQALLAMAFTEGHQATGDAAFRATAEGIFAYVARDLTSPEGAFFSAEDADSLNTHGEKEEGAFYVWTEDELRAALGDEDSLLARALYGTEPEGNFADEATRQKTGANVLHHPADPDATAARLERTAAELAAREAAIQSTLFDVRATRPRPLLDDKVLTDWNGLMIAALARAARAFDAPAYAERAARAAGFLLDTLRGADGTLLHRYHSGEAGIPAFLDDYAFLAWGLTELYQATFEERWLRAALDLHREAAARFADPERGGFYLTEEGATDLIVRPKEAYDGALPSGQSVMAYNALRLGRLTGDPALDDEAARTLAADAAVTAYPDAHTFWMTALSFAAGPAQEVVIAGGRDADDTRAMAGAFGRAYAPNAVVLLRAPGAGPAPITELAPLTEAQTALDGRATAYVCERFACQAPTTDPTEAVRLLLGA
jgi:uncharacterized protein YyaL (SSP411 family)